MTASNAQTAIPKLSSASFRRSVPAHAAAQALAALPERDSVAGSAMRSAFGQVVSTTDPVFPQLHMRRLLMFTFRPIGRIRTPYQDTKAIPKGLGAKHDAEGVLEILPEFGAGLLDIEGFSHLFVFWVFDRSEGFDLVSRPPIDNREHGVFATRSPRRPNPIGLTVVELIRRDGPRLFVRGVDMLDSTPILDIKPYLSGIPPEKLRRGWLAEAEARDDRERGGRA